MRQITEALTHPLQTFEEQAPYAAEVWPTFDDFWTAYAYKKGKAQAQKAWNKLNQDDRIAAVQYLDGYIPNTYTDGRYPSRRHPATYLNGRTWEDELTVIAKPVAGLDRAQGEAEKLAAMYADQAPDNGTR